MPSFIKDLEGDELIIARNKQAYEGKLLIWGADGEDDDEDSDEDESDDDSDDGDGDDDDEDEDEDKKPVAKKKVAIKSKDDDDDDDDEDDAEKELARLKRENIKLKKDAQAKKDKEDADGDLQKRHNKVVKHNVKLEKFVNAHLIGAAIVEASSGKYDWHDTGDVAGAIDRDAININLDTGEIEGLDVELKRIAKKKPHWLKDSESDDDSGRGNRQQRRPPPPGGTGNHPFGGAPRKQVTDSDKLKAKYKIGSPMRTVAG